MSRVVDEHRLYLADEPRVDAFRRAIEATVRPGDVVLDLGAGTGILGLLAARAGASRVYSVEASSLIGLTRQLASANGFSDRYTFIRRASTEVDLPEQVDVVVADQIGRFGFEAGVFEYFSDARARMLKPGGRTVPSRVELWAAPVEEPERWGHIDFWRGQVWGFDMAPARDIASNTGYPLRLEADQLLAPPARLMEADPGEPQDQPWRMQASFEAARAGVLHGVGGWFRAELAPGVWMSNSPLDPRRILRRNVFFPVDQPVPVGVGDRVDLRMQVLSADSVVSWRVDVFAAGTEEPRGSFAHSTWQGMLLSHEDLHRTQPDFVPHLTPRGEARRTVLELCDGTTTLAEVEKELRRRHPMFATAGEAQLFVAEVVTRYAD